MSLSSCEEGEKYLPALVKFLVLPAIRPLILLRGAFRLRAFVVDSRREGDDGDGEEERWSTSCNLMEGRCDEEMET